VNLSLLSSVARFSSRELLARVKDLVAHEREATAVLIAHLAELDRRRLYLGEGYSSLFTYCTQALYLPSTPPTGALRPLGYCGVSR